MHAFGRILAAIFAELFFKEIKKETLKAKNEVFIMCLLISEVFIIQVIVTPSNDWLEASYRTHHAQKNFFLSSKNASLMSDDKYCRNFYN